MPLPTCAVNPGLAVYVDEAHQTIRPRAHLTCSPIRQLNASQALLTSATVSEVSQLIRYSNERLDPHLGDGVDVYCAAPGIEGIAWFAGVFRQAFKEVADECEVVRLHCFSVVEASQIAGWEKLVAGPGFSGLNAGVFLLPRGFRGESPDRLRSNAIIAHLLRTFALTGRSRFTESELSFSTRRSQPGRHLSLSVLESYKTQDAVAVSSYLMDQALLGHLQAQYSPLVRHHIGERVDEFPSASFEGKLLRIARNSECLEDTATQLLADARLSEGGIAVSRFLADKKNGEGPPAPEVHAYETSYDALSHPEILGFAETAVSSLIGDFPIPVQHYAGIESRLTKVLFQRHKVLLNEVTDGVRRTFRDWSLRQHREWTRPDQSMPGSSTALLGALGSDFSPYVSRKSRAYVSAHVDPHVTRDTREELCPGSEQIQFIHTVPLWVEEVR